MSKKLTAESIVERILFGKAGKKADYVLDIKNLVYQSNKDQRKLCADEVRNEPENQTLIECIRENIKNAPSPEQ